MILPASLQVNGLCVRGFAEKVEQQSILALQLAVSSKDQLNVALQQTCGVLWLVIK